MHKKSPKDPPAFQDGLPLAPNIAPRAQAAQKDASRHPEGLALRRSAPAEAHPDADLTTTLVVRGMTCGSCVRSVERALKDVDRTRVQSATVDLAAATAVVVHDRRFVPVSALITAVEDAGFSAESPEDTPESASTAVSPRVSPARPAFAATAAAHVLTPAVAVLRVKGMTCASCVAAVERALTLTPGVVSAAVALLAETARIEYDDSVLLPEQLADAVNDAGFDASVLKAGPSSTAPPEPQQRRYSLARESADAGGGEHVRRADLQLNPGPSPSPAATAERVQAALKTLPGVQSLVFNDTNGTAVVHYDSQAVGLRDLVERLAARGFPDAAVRAATADAATNAQVASLRRTAETAHWRRIFAASLAFSVPVYLLSMVLADAPLTGPWLDTDVVPGLARGSLLQLALAAPAQIGVGRVFYSAALRAVRHGHYTMDVLVALGTSIAFAFSVASLLANMAVGSRAVAVTYFETSTTLLTFIALGRFLENRAKGSTSSTLSRLLQLAPQTALLVEQPGDTTRRIPSELVQRNDVLRIRPGDRIPVDGVAVSGASDVDESIVTGESAAVAKRPGDALIAGTTNGHGTLDMRATRVGQDTSLAQIVRLMEDAQTSRAPIQAFADRVAGRFVPVVIVLGAVTFVGWFFLLVALGYVPDVLAHDHHMHPAPGDSTVSGPEGVSGYALVALKLAMSVIMVACPCALGLATPTAVMVGTGVGAQLGILIKGGEPLEMAHRISRVLFDKTGTLTVGRLGVVGFSLFRKSLPLPALAASDAPPMSIDTRTLPLLDQDLFWRLIAAVESRSEHVIATALLEHAQTTAAKHASDPLPALVTSDFTAIPGAGVRASIAIGQTEPVAVLVGNLGLLRQHNVATTPPMQRLVDRQGARGRTVVFAALNGVPIGSVSLADRLRPEAPLAVRLLRRMNIRVTMLTGDQAQTAKTVADACGIHDVYSGVAPKRKLQIVAEMQQQVPQQRVAMVGDGINDSAALSKADLGIAMGSGTDIAIEAASIILINSDLLDVVASIDLSRTIFRRIRLNMLFASLYNVLMIPLAMGLGVPFGLTLHPMFAGLAMSLSSVSVVLSSLALKLYRKPNYRTRLAARAPRSLVRGDAVGPAEFVFSGLSDRGPALSLREKAWRWLAQRGLVRPGRMRVPTAPSVATDSEQSDDDGQAIPLRPFNHATGDSRTGGSVSGDSLAAEDALFFDPGTGDALDHDFEVDSALQELVTMRDAIETSSSTFPDGAPPAVGRLASPLW